ETWVAVRRVVFRWSRGSLAPSRVWGAPLTPSTRSPRPRPLCRGSPLSPWRRGGRCCFPPRIFCALRPSPVGLCARVPARAALRPRPAAGRTGHRVLDAHLPSTAAGDLVEGDLQLHLGVSAGSGSPPPSDRTASEEVLEEGPAEASGPPEERLEEIAAENVFD